MKLRSIFTVKKKNTKKFKWIWGGECAVDSLNLIEIFLCFFQPNLLL